MRRTICIYQPNVFPPLHYFNRILNSDVWVILEDVQINRKVGQTRLQLKVNGLEHRVTIPVLGGNRVIINEASIPYSQWVEKFRKTLENAYGKSPYYDTVQSVVIEYAELHQSLNSDFGRFCELFTLSMLHKLGWQGEAVSSEGMAEDKKASERMAEIAFLLNGTHYACGQEGFQQYLNLDHFRNRKLAVMVQRWSCPEYPQSEGKFLHNLSIIDLIANVGIEGARERLVSGGTTGWQVYG